MHQIDCLHTSNGNNILHLNHPNGTKINSQDLVQVVAVILMVNRDLMTIPANPNPAWGKNCNHCKIPNYFALVCQQKSSDFASPLVAHVQYGHSSDT